MTASCNSDNDEENENASTEESDAIADIEEKLDVKMPEFYYRPYGMEFLEYIGKSMLTDLCNGLSINIKSNIIFFYIDKQDNEYSK